jgi:mannose-6-phosphate isomerase-like protein (cupin superfamily)
MTPSTARAVSQIRDGNCRIHGETLSPVSHQPFDTKSLPVAPDAVAPDGSDVRVLLATTRGSLAHFELAAGETSLAVRHRTVEEIWYFLHGRGEMWRQLDGHEQTVEVASGVCITIPTGAAFQFRATEKEPLTAIGATMPPWPGAGEAVIVDGPWKPTLAPGPP